MFGEEFGGIGQPGGGMPDMSALLEQAQKMQEQLLAAKEELGNARVTGEAASGLVRATVSGTGELVSLDIKPEALDPDDTELLGDMIVAAVRDAGELADQLAAEKMGPFAGGLGGGGLGDMLGGGGGGPAGQLGF